MKTLMPERRPRPDLHTLSLYLNVRAHLPFYIPVYVRIHVTMYTGTINCSIGEVQKISCAEHF